MHKEKQMNPAVTLEHERDRNAGDHENMIDLIIANTEQTTPITGVVVGTFLGRDDQGKYRVDHPENRSGLSIPARAAAAIDDHHQGKEVALMFEEGNPMKPIIMGLMHSPDKSDVHVISDPEELILHCGKASIHMKKDGTIRIKGTNIESRASHNHEIKGGMIHLN